jgi:hypothetical protein
VIGGQLLADWLMLVGAVALFVSLFLTWSHQLSRTLLTALAGSPAIRGVPANPTAWQVYSVADVLLALLAAALVAVALRGRSRAVRVAVLMAVGGGLAFAVHAHSVAPTNGLLIIDPNHPSAYLPHVATPGAGETVAIVALAAAAVGLMAALGVDLSSNRVSNERG